MNLNDVVCQDGGTMREFYKVEGWGQMAMRTVLPGMKKPGHRHNRRNERWILVRGSGVFMTLEQSDGSGWRFPLPLWHPVTVPAGVGHAVENLGDEECAIVFYSDQIYDPENPDKETWEL